ncbi:hypothetical protein NDGK_00234 [Clostridiales bacterium CHKCI001]|nr:hypothetical protein NDGK_00234 [Clostridiales bacterium CHKCI001]
MKGLLVKDFKLMKLQKTFFLLIVVIAVGMIAFTDDVTFPLGFLTFVISLFTLSTISYDEFDNGNAFLFTLPITRTNYVVEKYCLGLLLGCGTWIFATLLTMIASILKSTLPVADIMMIALMILPIMIVIQAIMIPFQLKFGGEKGRIALIGAIGLVFLIGVVIVKGAEMIGIDIANVINTLPIVNMGMLITIILAVAVVLFLISLKISITIMNKKEF